MLLWYVGMSVFLVAAVFRSSGIDYRLIAVGSMLPLVVDFPIGYRAYGHTLVFAAALLTIAMLATIGRPRLLRRRVLCVPIGVFCGLVLSGAFLHSDLFWWPALGTSFAHEPVLPVAWVVAVEELAGLVACWFVVGRYDLYLPGPRREFVRSGRLRGVT